jgi:hypothetical protein
MVAGVLLFGASIEASKTSVVLSGLSHLITVLSVVKVMFIHGALSGPLAYVLFSNFLFGGYYMLSASNQDATPVQKRRNSLVHSSA